MTEGQSPSHTNRGASAPVVALATGLALVWLATPRIVAAIAELPARPVISELRSGERLEPRYLEIAAKSQAAALRWVADGRGWAGLGLIRFIEARRLGLAGDEGRAALDQSLAAHRRAVSLSPEQAYVWSRLAHAELLRGGPSPRLGPLLERAIATAPFDPDLVFPRLELCFLTWRQLDPSVRELAAGQVRFAARIAPERLAALARERYAMAAVRDALADTPALRGRVDYYLRRP